MTTTTTKETGMIEDIHAAVRAILSEETARAVDNQARDHAKVLTAQCEAAEAERDVLRAQVGALCAVIASWREKALKACEKPLADCDCCGCIYRELR